MNRLLESMELPEQLSNGIALMSPKTTGPQDRRYPLKSSRPATMDWTRVTVEHVRQACAMFDSGRAVPKRLVQSLVLLVDGRRYPAKFIQQAAYRLAVGGNKDIGQRRYRDSNTIGFFENLGLTAHLGPSQLVSPAGAKRNSA